MSSDFRKTKNNPSGLYPQKSVNINGQNSGFSRVEPWMTVERLKDEFLFGIPLTSSITKQTMSNNMLQSVIRRAAANLELKLKIDVTPVQRFERLDFDRTKLNQAFNELQLGFGNISSIQEVAIRAVDSQPQTVVSIQPAPIGIVAVSGVVTVTTIGLHNLFPNTLVDINDALNPSFNGTHTVIDTPTSTTFTFSLALPDTTSGNGNITADGSYGQLLYAVPLAWVDLSMASKGILHFVPLQSTYGSYGASGIAGGPMTPLLMNLNSVPWIPAYWSVTYTCGFNENSIPSPINDLIGTYAAMEVLSLLGPLNRNNSQSISLDGASQSTSGVGPQLYVVRYQQLQEKAKDLEDLIKSRFGKKIFMSNW